MNGEYPSPPTAAIPVPTLALRILLLAAALVSVSGDSTANVSASGPARLDGLFANEPPDEELRGETVYAVVGPKSTEIEAIFDISGFPTSLRGVWLPVFASAGTSGKEVFQGAMVRASLNGKALRSISLETAPGGTPPVPDDLQIVWVRIQLGYEGPGQREKNRRIRISYTQHHVQGRFHYLPQSVPHPAPDMDGLDWRFQLIAHSPRKKTGRRGRRFPVGAPRRGSGNLSPNQQYRRPGTALRTPRRFQRRMLWSPSHD